MTLDYTWYSEIDHRGLALSFKILERAHQERTAYQDIAIYLTEQFGYLMTLDDIVMLSSKDNFIYHEMMVHPALFSHPHPKNIVIVGGGDCGSLNQVLQHRVVEHVTQVELDERVTRVSEKYFPELCANNHDKRVRFLFEDAVAWMGDGSEGDADVIILDTTDPVGQAKRLFQQQFYSDCYDALDEGGILVAQSESPYWDIPLILEMRRGMSAAGFVAIKTIHFPVIFYPSGWWSATMACKTRDPSYDFSIKRPSSDLKTNYYNQNIHEASGFLPRFMQESLN